LILGENKSRIAGIGPRLDICSLSAACRATCS
jgi:hypothetical protein